jgi:hypothetical protein
LADEDLVRWCSPLAVELGALDVDGGHLGIRYDNAAGILAGVELAAHGEAGFGVLAEISSVLGLDPGITR